MEAASAASAQPSVSTRTKCSGFPAPPLAMIGNVGGARDGLGERAIEAVLHAVGVHGGEQDFAGAERFAARGPGDGVDAFVVAAAAGVDVPFAGRMAAGVDGQDDGLRAEFVAEFGDELGTADGGGVDGDFVGAGHAGCGGRRRRSGCRRRRRAG